MYLIVYLPGGRVVVVIVVVMAAETNGYTEAMLKCFQIIII